VRGVKVSSTNQKPNRLEFTTALSSSSVMLCGAVRASRLLALLCQPVIWELEDGLMIFIDTCTADCLVKVCAVVFLSLL